MPNRDFIPRLPTGLLRVRLGWLLGLGLLQLGLYAAITDLSFQFRWAGDSSDRPALLVLGLLTATFVLYLGSLAVAQPRDQSEEDPANRMAYDRWSLAVILMLAVLLRVVLWPSYPIHHADVFRCIWDGRVAAEGVAPYRYSPADVARFGTDPDAPGELRRLAVLASGSPALQTIFAQIQHREDSTLYPPLSQAVVALAAMLSPDQASVSFHIWMLKSLILAFDLITVLLVLGVLRELGRPAFWLLAYAWCPLVLKEFANSAHIDAAAVCLLTATLYVMLRAARPDYRSTDISGETESRAFATGLFFGGATLAMLFPLLLLPLFLRWWWRRLRWRFVFPLAGSLLVLGTVYGPLLFHYYSQEAALSTRSLQQTELTPQPRHPLEGLGVLLSRPEINDFLFATVVENLRIDRQPDQEPWFAVIPRAARQSLLGWTASSLESVGFRVDRTGVAHLLARVLVGAALAVILVWLATRSWPADGRLNLVHAAFLSLAWAWLLSPDQNPWYWCWAMPLVVFASRPWLLVSGLALLYYLRFWLVDHYTLQPLWRSYDGARFFDQIVVVLEHLPVLLLLLCIGLRARHRTGR